MTLPHVKRKKAVPKRQPRTMGFTQDQLAHLSRINRDAVKEHRFHEESALLRENLKRKQRISTYEGERDRFEMARIKGPLRREENARLGQLKTLLGK